MAAAPVNLLPRILAMSEEFADAARHSPPPPGPTGLVFSALARCRCGAGLAFDPQGSSGNAEHGYWACWLLLRGRAPWGIDHDERLPFSETRVTREMLTARGEISTRPDEY